MRALNSGASHVLLPLRELPSVAFRPARHVALRLAAGRVQRAKMVDVEVFAPGVLRPLCPMGRVISRLGLRFNWDASHCSPSTPLIQCRDMDFFTCQERRQGDRDFGYSWWQEALGLPDESEAAPLASAPPMAASVAPARNHCSDPSGNLRQRTPVAQPA